MFFDETEKGIILRIRISPNSSSCSVKGIFISADREEFLKVDVVSVPEKGKANKELIKFLAKKLGIAKSNLDIVFGELDRYKRVLIKEDVREKLLSLIEGY